MRRLTLLTLLLVATMAAAPAYASSAAPQDYLLAHLCRSYTAAQNAELPRVVHLRAALQRAQQPNHPGSAAVSAFWTPSAIAAPLLAVSTLPASPASPTLLALRDTLQPNAPPARG